MKGIIALILLASLTNFYAGIVLADDVNTNEMPFGETNIGKAVISKIEIDEGGFNLLENSVIDVNGFTETIINGIQNRKESIDVRMFNICYPAKLVNGKYAITDGSADFSKLYNNVVFSNPTLCVSTGCSMELSIINNNTAKITSVYPHYLCDTLDEQNEYVNRLIQDINEVVDYAMQVPTDLERALLANDKIISLYSYDPSTSGFAPITFTAFGFSENGYGVCQCYSLFYKAVLDRLGIENALCNSEAKNHIWNYVKINKNWYHCDATWDDSFSGNVNFLNSDAKICENGHGVPSDWDVFCRDEAPICNSTEYESGYLFNDANVDTHYESIIEYNSGKYEIKRHYAGGECFTIQSNTIKPMDVLMIKPEYDMSSNSIVIGFCTLSKLSYTIGGKKIIISYYDKNNRNLYFESLSLSDGATLSDNLILSLLYLNSRYKTDGGYLKIFIFDTDYITPQSEYQKINF